MATEHHHDHHHHHHHHHGPVGDVEGEAPLDAANQSLADALRASFSILKFVMLILVVLYCFSGVRFVQENQEAVVLRFGKLLPEVRGPGLSLAFPYPIDETLVFSTKKDNTFLVRSHWPKVKPDEINQPLDKVRRSGGLKPGVDGYLLTADSGMVHFQWKVRYRVDDLRRYVLTVADDKTEKLEDLITSLLEEAAIRVVSGFTAEEARAAETNVIAAAVRGEVNERLEELQTGAVVVALDPEHASVPGQTIEAFDAVTKAENQRDKDILDARQKRSEILNAAAGPAFEELIGTENEMGLLDRYLRAKAEGDLAEAERIGGEIQELLEIRAGGAAGQAVRRAKGYYTRVIQEVRGDLRRYEASLDEYREAPQLFVSRMWERTRSRLLQLPGIKKHFLSGRENEIRIKIGPDPEQARIEEMERLREEAQEYDFRSKSRHLKLGM